jgi:hypothetical protein
MTIPTYTNFCLVSLFGLLACGCDGKGNNAQELTYVHETLPDTLKIRVDVDSSTVKILEVASGDISLFPEEEGGVGFRRSTGCEVVDERNWRCWNELRDVGNIGEDDSYSFKFIGERDSFRQEFTYYENGKTVLKKVTYNLIK